MLSDKFAGKFADIPPSTRVLMVSLVVVCVVYFVGYKLGDVAFKSLFKAPKFDIRLKVDTSYVRTASQVLARKSRILSKLEALSSYPSVVYRISIPVDAFSRVDETKRVKKPTVPAPVKVKPFVAFNLKVEGIVYSPDREFRMVKVGGQYLREGDVAVFGKPSVILRVLEIDENGFSALITGEGESRRVWLKVGENMVYF